MLGSGFKVYSESFHDAQNLSEFGGLSGRLVQFGALVAELMIRSTLQVVFGTGQCTCAYQNSMSPQPHGAEGHACFLISAVPSPSPSAAKLP